MIMRLTIIYFITIANSEYVYGRIYLPDRTYLDNFTVLIKEIAFAVGSRTTLPKFLRAARKINKLQDVVPDSVPFPCDIRKSRSQEKPEDADHLRPGDIDVIGAMGDSLTAGTGAAGSKFIHIATENRGISWSGGGQGTWRTFLTLPNIFKEFNPNLIGYALSDSLTHDRASQFNVGEPGAMTRDLPHMATILVKRIRADRRVNFTQDWKLVTIMMGANDFCSNVCYEESVEKMERSHEIFRQNLITTLDYLRDNMPRTFVNVLVPPSMEILLNFVGEVPFCKALHIAECPCIFGKHRIKSRPRMIKIMKRWQRVIEEVCLLERYQRKDFAAVMQPFIAQLRLPLVNTTRGRITDFTILSEDCFHFSQKGFARATNAYWNNILEPVGGKTLNWTDTFEKFLCPTDDQPYLRTIANSGVSARKLIIT